MGWRDAGMQGDFVVSAKDEKQTPPSKAGSNASRTGGANVGEALRAVYRDAVAENIPDEMLDLLNKLA
jgi:hypothetical protein